jgi:hypothetical protein
MKTSIRLLIVVLVCASVSCSSKKEKEPTASIPATNDTINTAKPDPASGKYVMVDTSPMDMSYYPDNYPKLKMGHETSDPPLARVVYSRPHLGGRQLFHTILKYGESWRLGANESTELQLYRKATINGKTIPAGRYILYCIPQPDAWTIVFNSNLDSWGLLQDTTKDIARFNVPVTHDNPRLEYFTMIFEDKDGHAELVMAWDKTEARLPISF